jgi:hypothetical protein
MVLTAGITFSQELLINVSLKQPKKMEINAGEDIRIENPENVTIGENVSVTGGTPGYQYSWADAYGNNFDSQIVTVSSFGRYYLTVTDINNCSAVDSVEVINSVDINYLTENNSFILFPNPASGSVFIPLRDFSNESTLQDELRLQIISVLGKTVYRDKIKISEPGSYYEIQTANLPEGIYHIVLGNNRTKNVYKIVLE